MQRTLIILAVAIAVIFLVGYIAVPWAKSYLFGNSRDVRVNILSAVEDPEVGVPGSKDTVARIVVEMEVIFPYGAAPEIGALNVRGDDGAKVDVVWGSRVHEPEKHDLEDSSQSKIIFREAFFPIDFKQGMLREGDRDIVYFKMPKLPFNAPSK